MPQQKSLKYTGPTPPRRLLAGIEQIESKMEEGDYETAGSLLHSLEAKFHENPILQMAAYNYYAQTENYFALESICRSLYAAHKHDPDIALATATTYMMNERLGMARKVFVDFLRRWPDHGDATDIRKTVEALKSTLMEQAEPNVTESEFLEELMVLHDEVRYALDHQLYYQGQRLAERVRAKYPTFTPVINNLAQIHYLQGNLSKAIQICHEALALSPDNIHALANYARMLYISGNETEAREVVERLRKSEESASDKWTKISETLGFIGDDHGLLELYARVKAANQLSDEYVSPLFYHLIAVACANEGKDKEAKALWKKALELDPEFEFALENLKDLGLPKYERNGAWAFTLQYWFPSLGNEMERALGSSGKQAEKFINDFINNHPEILRLAPVLFQRQDSASRQFLIGIAGFSNNEELCAAAKEFALGQKGSDQLRLEAAQMLSRNKRLPNGPTRMWIKGEWQEALMFGFEVNGEPRLDLPQAAMDMYLQATQALRNEDGAKAEQILENAVKRYPNNPSLWNNLAAAYELQGKFDKSEKMVDAVVARFPDYFFGILARARREMNGGNYAAAHELINGALQRQSLHFSEYESLCIIQIDLSLLEGHKDTAKQWLDMWEKIMPDSSAVKAYKRKMRGRVASSGPSRSNRSKVKKR